MKHILLRITILFCVLNAFESPKIPLVVADVQPKPVEYKLKHNSLWFENKPELGFVSIVIAFKGAGVDFVEANMITTASMAPELLFQGAKGKTLEQIQNLMRKENISLTFSYSPHILNSNALCATLRVPKDKITLGLNLILDHFLSPKCSDKDLKREVAKYRNFFQQKLHDPATIANDVILKTFYRGNYGTTTAEYLTLLNTVSLSRLRTFLKQKINQKNIYVGACGDVEPELLVSEINRFMEKLPVGKVATMPAEQSIRAQPIVKKHIPYPVPQAKIKLIRSGVDQEHPDYWPVKILSQVLGSFAFGKLWEAVRSEKGLTYGLNVSVNNDIISSQLEIETSTKIATIDTALNTINATLEKIIQQQGIDQEIVDKAKGLILNKIDQQFTDTISKAAFFAGLNMEEKPLNYLEQEKQRIRNVSLQGCQDAMKKYFDPNTFHQFVIGGGV